MMMKGLGEALWREKEKLALAWFEETLHILKRPLTSDAWLGVSLRTPAITHLHCYINTYILAI
jgi:hypothetical protein